MEQASQDFDEDLTQIAQTQEMRMETTEEGSSRNQRCLAVKTFLKKKTSEKRKEREEMSQYGSVILFDEVQRMQKETENTSKEIMSPRAVRRSFCLRFRRQLEEILQDMHPNYTPSQDE